MKYNTITGSFLTSNNMENARIYFKNDNRNNLIFCAGTNSYSDFINPIASVQSTSSIW